ncbi:FAD/NAD(P)-binding domain-containing protein [Wilcoxina mikolae CBS 423.85]|nr:FAD/NAD(P)-binding domain-containing protein [Wilcoxina mikolae CBS 423.85]
MASAVSLDIIIVGAGLGGLSAAIAARLAGHSVRLVEQAHHLGEVGAGIQVPPNASRILGRWGLADAFNQVSVSPHALRLRSYSDGKILSEQPFIPMVQDTYGAPYCNVHRADYHNLLVDKCRSLDVTVLLDSHVHTADLSAPSITLLNGTTLTSDLIIGADGLKSKLRALLLNRPSPPYLTGDLAYRILISASLMREDPDLAELATTPMFNIWMGPRAHAVCYLLKGAQVYNIVLCCPDNLPEDVNIAPAAPGELESFFASWDPRLQKLLALSHDVSKWRLQNSRQLETWVHDSGKFTLLGDSCHATLPYLAQGAAMAIEDGAVLGGLLGKLQRKEQLGDILKIYESLRKARTERVVEGSTHQQDVFHLEDGEKQRERDEVLLKDEVKPGFPNKWRDDEFRDWLFGYDAFEEGGSGGRRR